MFDISQVVETTYNNFMNGAQEILPKIFWALLILALWLAIARALFLFVMYLFKKFRIIDFLNKLQLNVTDETEIEEHKEGKPKKSINFFGDKIKVDSIVAKAISYYIFLVFFRLAIKYIGIEEVEEFLDSIIHYLPKLFIWIVIWFFWVRFSSFVHDILYHTLDLTKQNNARVVAIIWKIIVLFFTTLAVLNQIEIVDEVIYHTILIWFISMISLAWGLAFGLWGKDFAKEILESFKK